MTKTVVLSSFTSQKIFSRSAGLFLARYRMNLLKRYRMKHPNKEASEAKTLVEDRALVWKLLAARRSDYFFQT